MSERAQLGRALGTTFGTSLGTSLCIALGRTLGGALAALAATGCVRVDPGPNGVAAARLDATPPSIVAGDQLRDSLGAVTTLRALVFDASGRPAPTAPLRFAYVPSLRDTLQRLVPDTALVVDSLTGAVRATRPFVLARALVAARAGGRIQLVDTLDIVPRPDSALVDTAVTLALRYDCTDLGTVLRQRPLAAAANGFDTAFVYNALGPFRVRVRGDSLGGSAGSTVATRVNVRRRLVRWRVDSGPAVPAYRLPTGGPADTVAPLAVVSAAADRLLRFDTTDVSGLSAVRLRIRPAGLGRATVAATDFTVRLRADVQPGPVPIAGGVQFFRVRLQRNPVPIGPAPVTCQ